jgi:hypothetical protein
VSSGYTLDAFGYFFLILTVANGDADEGFRENLQDCFQIAIFKRQCLLVEAVRRFFVGF